MYWSDKCCFCVSLEVGGLLVGGVSLVLSALSCAVSSVVLYVPHVTRWLVQQGAGEEGVDPRRVSSVAAGGALAGLLGLIASTLLLLGIRMKRPGFVLSYFFYSIILVILALLATLIALLQRCWWLALAHLALTGMLVQWSSVAHRLHEALLRLEGRSDVAPLTLHQEPDDHHCC